MKYMFTLVLCTISLLSGAQGLKQKTADKYFTNLAYSSAVGYYKDLTDTRTPAETNLRRLALCYYNLQDYPSAQEAFQRLRQTFPDRITETDLLDYLQCLKYNGKYADAQGVLEQLHARTPASLVYKHHHAAPAYDTDLKKDSVRYKITNVEALNTQYSEFFPYMDKQLKNLLFVSNRRNVAARNKTFAWDDSYFTDTYAAKQKDSVSFQVPLTVTGQFATKYHDGPMMLSADGNTMYMTRTNYIDRKIGESSAHHINLKLLVFKRDATGQWDKGTPFPYCSDEYSLGHAALSRDNQRLYFVSDMPGGYGQTDLWCSEFKDSQWQKPVNLGDKINTEGREMFPYINDDGILFFASDGYAGLGGLDICYAFPNQKGFVEGRVLGYPINTRFDDFGFYLNNDLKTGYLSSNRDGGKGKDDIYYFRSGQPLFGVKLKGKVFDDNTKEIIPFARLFLLDSQNNLVDSTHADASGNYLFMVSDPSVSYHLGAKERSKYYDRIIPVPALTTGSNTLDVYLFPKYKLICTVFDAKTSQPLPGVSATLINKYKDEKKNYTTDDAGTFNDLVRNKKAGDKIAYLVKFEKSGFITMVQEYEITLDTNTIINLNEKLNCFMQKMEKGADIGKIARINPIYFDLAKWDIRPDAAVELDKIVAVMKENPTMVIELGSHTDCRSSAAYNMKLSDKRAKSSAQYIISKGIESSRIYGKGYGESRLINQCACEGTKAVPCTEEQHQQNRRTEFIIVKY